MAKLDSKRVGDVWFALSMGAQHGALSLPVLYIALGMLLEDAGKEGFCVGWSEVGHPVVANVKH